MDVCYISPQHIMIMEEKNMEEQKDIDWLDNVKAPVDLKEMKGEVIKILQPREIETEKYGKRKLIEIIVKGEEGEVIATEFLPQQFPLIAKGSNLGKIMKKYELNTLKDLLGKEVELEEGKQDNLKIKK